MTSDTFHHRSFVFDVHCDSLGQAVAEPDYRRDLAVRGAFGHLDLPRMEAGGINCQVFACFPGESRLMAHPTAASLCRVEALYELMERAPSRLTLVRTAADLAGLHPGGPIGAVLGLEGAEALEGCMTRLHTFYRLGVRVLGLAWNGRNAACDGVEVGSAAGLTDFGRWVVAECNRLGIVLDLSHLNREGTAEVLARSQQPVIASHSNALALCRHPRNLDDGQLRAIAAKGGVVGATFVAMYLTDDPDEARISHLVDHIDHMVQVMGIDHVGLGSDFDGCTTPPDLDSGEAYPYVTEALLARGFAEQDVAQILGGNFRRVFTQVLPAGVDVR